MKETNDLLKEFLEKLYSTRNFNEVRDFLWPNAKFIGYEYNMIPLEHEQLHNMLLHLFPLNQAYELRFYKENHFTDQDGSGTVSMYVNFNSMEHIYTFQVVGSTKAIDGEVRFIFMQISLLRKDDVMSTQIAEVQSLKDFIMKRYIYALRINLESDYIEDLFNNIPEYFRVKVGDSYSGVLRIYDERFETSLSETFSVKRLLEQYHEGITETFTTFPMYLPATGTRIISFRNIIQETSDGKLILFHYTRDITKASLNERILQKIASDNYLSHYLIDLTSDVYIPFLPKDRFADLQASNLKYNSESIEKICHKVIPKDKERIMTSVTPDAIKCYLADHETMNLYFDILVENKIQNIHMSISYLDKDAGLILALLRDITAIVESNEAARTKLEDALKKATQASVAKTDFMSRMSHGIRTPLNAIMGLVRIAREENKEQEIEEYLSKIYKSTEFLKELLDDVLDISSLDSDELVLKEELFSHTEYLDAIMCATEPLTKQKQISLQIKTQNDVDYIYTDKHRYTQIFMNILMNSLKYTNRGGTVCLNSSFVKKDKDHGILTTIVEDNGVGMSPEFIERIYQPFEQEDNGIVDQWQGTGLGLTITKRTVDAMGGTIDIQSKINEGTRITVVLPVKCASKPVFEAAKKESSMIDNSIFEGKHVLVVEDNQINMLVTQKLLQSKKINYEGAENGKIAVDMYLEKPDNYYDAILMDIRMPIMDGNTACAAIRNSVKPDAKTIPIIAITANALIADIHESQKAGMSAHLSKPINPTLLFSTLAEKLSS